MSPSTSLLDGDSPTGANNAVSGGTIFFSSTATALGSFACPRSTPTLYLLGVYFGILGGWNPGSHAEITIRHLLSGWLLRSRRERGHSLCRRKRTEHRRCPATHRRTPGRNIAVASCS